MPSRATNILDHRGRPLVVNQSAYEAAGTTGRRTKGWQAPASGPNRALSYSLATLRNRSRAADRNNPWVWQAIDRLVSNEVGVGVTLRSRAKDEAFRKAANELWQTSRNQLDPERLLNFGGQQTQAVRARRTAGEVFLRRLRRSTGSNLAVPLQVQILEAEFVPLGDNRDLPNGHYIRDAIEYTRRGRRAAYWMHTAHPQDDTPTRDFGKLVRVPAQDVIHHYLPTRPGQRRGEPNSTRSLLPSHTFDKYEDAELVRKETRAPFTGTIHREAYSDADWKFDPFSGAPITEDGVPTVDVESGTFLSLLPGESMNLFEGDKGGEGFAEYARWVLLKVAAGYGVPYEILTGDWKEVNDRLVRAILNEFHRSIEAAQDHLLIFQVCLGVWSWWVDAALFAGALTAPGYAARRTELQAVQARPHGWKYVHPEQDVNAKIKEMEAQLTSRQTAIDERPGPSMEEIDEQIAEDAAAEGGDAAPEPPDRQPRTPRRYATD